MVACRFPFFAECFRDGVEEVQPGRPSGGAYLPEGAGMGMRLPELPAARTRIDGRTAVRKPLAGQVRIRRRMPSCDGAGNAPPRDQSGARRVESISRGAL